MKEQVGMGFATLYVFRGDQRIGGQVELVDHRLNGWAGAARCDCNAMSGRAQQVQQLVIGRSISWREGSREDERVGGDLVAAQRA